MKPRQLPVWSAPLAAAGVFLACAAPQLSLLGLGPDEAVHAEPALSWLYPQTFRTHWPYLPWMLSTYMGTLKSWIFYAAFALLGVSPLVLRVSMLACAAAGTAAWTWTAARLYGAPLGIAVGLWLAADPAWFLKAGHDTGPVVLSFALAGFACVCALQAWDVRRPRPWLAACGLALGLALWHKAHFAWWLIGAGAALTALARRELRRRFDMRDAACAAGGFLLGAGPFVHFNLAYPLATLNNEMHMGWSFGEHLGRLGEHSAHRFALLVRAFSGEGVVRFLSGEFGVVSPTRWVWLAFNPAALALAVYVGRHGLKRLRHAAFWTVFTLALLAAALLSPMPLKFHHLYLLFPLGQLLAAALLKEAFALAPRRAPRLAAAALALVFIAQAGLYARFRAAAANGGSDQFTPAVADMAAWCDDLLRREPGTRFWGSQGLDNQLPVYTGGRVHPHSFSLEKPIASMDEAELRRRYGFLLDPGVIVLHRAVGLNRDDGDRLEEAAARLDVADCLTPLRSFGYANGSPWAAAFRVCAQAPGRPGHRRRRALDLQREGRHAAARAALRALVAQSPRDAGLRHDLGVSEFRNGDSEAAARELKYALALDPKRADTYVSLGAVLAAMGRDAESRAVLERGRTAGLIP